MSPKRAAEIAFGEHESETPHTLKRKRRTKTHHRSARAQEAPLPTSLHETAPANEKPHLNILAPQQDILQVPAEGTKKSAKKRKNRKHRSKHLESQSESHALVAVDKEESKRKDRDDRKSRKWNSTYRDIAKNGWTLSPGTGGLFISQDPILTQDDKHLILPTTTSVLVYSTATSLMVRSLDVESSYITSCRLSLVDPEEVLVFLSNGCVSRWNWTTGQRLVDRTLGETAVRILSSFTTENVQCDQLICSKQSREGQTEIFCCNLDKAASGPVARNTIIARKKPMLSSSCASSDGTILVLCSGNKLFLGQRNQNQEKQPSFSYNWREATVPGNIFSMDTRFRPDQTRQGSNKVAVDVVLGLQNGVILVYEDILYKLVGKEKGIQTAQLSARRLHWHRDGVKTVKWSRDGNYLISGGNETVLVIWQLDTNQKQFLPHLATAILNLSVSTSGSSYALRLADNSVMVLSTADLKPLANVANLALGRAEDGQIPAIFHPHHLNRLVAAVPRVSIPSQNRNEKTNATLLQTFDVTAALQIDRQALTRNVITTLNVAPTGHKVVEPNVILLQLAHDGQWLITVDEWRPADQDLDALYPLSDKSRSEQNSKETCLRFWHWNDGAQTWGLVTRVDQPHAKAAVLGLTVHPTRNEVATIGSDGCLRLWSPKSRYRNGVSVRNESGEQLHTWKCSKVTQIENQDDSSSTTLNQSAALAYSEDGSVVAASWSLSTTPRFVHLVDSHSGALRLSQPSLLTSGKAQVAFLGRHLLCLSQSLLVWDTVNAKTTFSMSLSDSFIDPQNSMSIMAVNRVDGTFALGLSPTNARGSALEPGQLSQIVVFDIQKLKQGLLSQIKIRGNIKVLLPRQKAAGFVVIDDQNRVRQFAPAGLAEFGTSSLSVQSREVANSLENIFGAGRTGDQDVDGDDREMVSSLPEQEPRGIMKSLEGLFGFSGASTGRSVSDLFEKVAGLFARPSVSTE